MIRQSKPMNKLIIALVMGMLLLSMGPLSAVSANGAAAAKNITIKVNGNKVKLADPAFIYAGRLYVPAAVMAGRLGAKESWDKRNEELTLHTSSNDTVVLGNGVPVVYFNKMRYRMEAPPFLKKNRLYIPLRQLAELLDADMKSIAGTNVVELQTLRKPEVVAASFAVKADKVSSGGKPAGLKLAAAEPFTESDYKLLAKITMVEAGHESYQGQLALANVILNRVKDAQFPDSIHDVIYSGMQFPPAHNGLLDKSKPNATALRAAKDALNGRNNIGKAVYFFNPEVSKGPFWSSLDVIATIGHHRFAR